MNRIISALVICALVLSLTACTTSNPENPTTIQTDPTGNSACLHKLEILASSAGSCIESGCATSVCTLCGEEFTEETPAPGHDFSNATCTHAKTCTVCGITSGDALGHSYVSGKCDRCGAQMPGYEDQPTGCDHMYSLTAQTAPTCTSEGSLTYTCSSCGADYTETVKAKGHAYADATCELPKTCRVCITPNGIPLGHSYKDGQCIRCSAADPSVPKEITYTVTVRSDKGKLIEGVTVTVFTDGNAPASAKTNSKGVATMPLMAAPSYRLVLSDVPPDYIAKESYTFRSTIANINLTTRSQTTLTDHNNGNYKVGSIMGDFALTDTDGNQYVLSELLNEKELVVLNFWYVTCAPCKAEFPYFESVYKEYANVQLLTMNNLDAEDQIKALREQMGVTFPMIAEDIGFRQGFGIEMYPTTVFIGNDGKILQIKVGEFKSEEEFRNSIERFLK